MYNFSQPQVSPVNATARSQTVMTFVCPDDTLQIDEPQPGEPGWNQGQGCGGIWNWDIYARTRLNYAACYGNAGYNQTTLGGVTFLGGMFTNGRGLLYGLDPGRRQQHAGLQRGPARPRAVLRGPARRRHVGRGRPGLRGLCDAELLGPRRGVQCLPAHPA